MEVQIFRLLSGIDICFFTSCMKIWRNLFLHVFIGMIFAPYGFLHRGKYAGCVSAILKMERWSVGNA